MFGRSSSETLTLVLGDHRYEFATPEDLGFALAGRAGVPGSRVGSLVEMGDEALRREAEAIRQVEKLFNNALDGSLQEVTRISPFLKEIDTNLISQDHDWRAIISALNGLSEPFEPFKKIALVKYTQYLAARRQAVTAIYASRKHAKMDSNLGSDSQLRETAIFDLSEFPGEEGAEFSRVPKGETVEVDLSMEGSVHVLLAKHRCRVESPGKPVFVDDNEQVTKLRRGKNIIGRDATCDVLINVAYRDVSRKHLIIEVADENNVRLTDISSHGTSLSSHLLENTSI